MNIMYGNVIDYRIYEPTLSILLLYSVLRIFEVSGEEWSSVVAKVVKRSTYKKVTIVTFRLDKNCCARALLIIYCILAAKQVIRK